jgi:hypothetical protein
MAAVGLVRSLNNLDRRTITGGSDARIIMGQDEKALIRLWQEKRGEVGPEDLSGNLIVQLGLATEDLNRTSKSVAPLLLPWSFWGRAAAEKGALQHNATLFAGLPSNSIAEPDTRAPSVLVDEFDACGFESPPNGKVIRRCHHGRFFG